MLFCWPRLGLAGLLVEAMFHCACVQGLQMGWLLVLVMSNCTPSVKIGWLAGPGCVLLRFQAPNSLACWSWPRSNALLMLQVSWLAGPGFVFCSARLQSHWFAGPHYVIFAHPPTQQAASVGLRSESAIVLTHTGCGLRRCTAQKHMIPSLWLSYP